MDARIHKSHLLSPSPSGVLYCSLSFLSDEPPPLNLDCSEWPVPNYSQACMTLAKVRSNINLFLCHVMEDVHLKMPPDVTQRQTCTFPSATLKLHIQHSCARQSEGHAQLQWEAGMCAALCPCKFCVYLKLRQLLMLHKK